MPVIAVTRRQLHHATGHDRIPSAWNTRIGLDKLFFPDTSAITIPSACGSSILPS